MTNEVYITDMARFLPNAPVGNDDMERILGRVGDKPSRSRRLVLRNNGIETRYYAIDPETGAFTHNNSRMAAEAVRALAERAGLGLEQVECLCCGTSGPDQIKPAHGHMVHGELGTPPCEVVTTAGVCTSGITALKYAYMSVALGETTNAVSAGSEFSSSFMRSNQFQREIEARVDALHKHPHLAFEEDFLRWMLSDGAGAALLRNTPNPDRISLRVDWIDNLSYAGEMPVCMYSGAVKREDGSLQGWREVDDPMEAVSGGYFAVKQDARLLEEHVMHITVSRTLATVARRRGLSPGDVTWFLPHYSSAYFRQRAYDALVAIDFEIPYERWFTNLSRVGNIGAASMYLILEELFYSGRLNKGDTLLCYVPESARFSSCFMHFTVV